MPLELVTIVHRSWDFPISDFVLPLHEDPDGQLRKDLAVTGVSDSAGFLIAYPEVDFDPADDGFQVYFHGIVTGAKIKALQNLRKAAGYDGASLSYRPLITGPRPYSRVQIATALNRFWPQQTWGTFGYRLKPERRAVQTPLQPVYQLLYLRWLERKAISDTFVLDGVRIGERKLLLT
jgi:hypothetical protein